VAIKEIVPFAKVKLIKVPHKKTPEEDNPDLPSLNQ
jgi:hypothetical protein